MIHITSERWEKYKHDIVEDDYYASKEFETTTLYFMAPAGIADGCTNEDVSVEISMEFPTLDDAIAEASNAKYQKFFEELGIPYDLPIKSGTTRVYVTDGCDPDLLMYNTRKFRVEFAVDNDDLVRLIPQAGKPAWRPDW